MYVTSQANSEAASPLHVQMAEPIAGGPISTDAQLLLAQARNLAFSEAAQGRLSNGLSLLEEALEQEPMAHDLLSDMAALLLSVGQLGHAQVAAERALALQPQHGASLYSLAFSLSGQGQILRARDVLVQLLGGDALASLSEEAPELLPVARNELERLNLLVINCGINPAA